MLTGPERDAGNRKVMRAEKASRSVRKTSIYGLVAGTAMVSLVLALTGASSHPESPANQRSLASQPFTSVELSRLDTIAHALAAGDGDRVPSSVSVVRTIHSQAMRSATPGDKWSKVASDPVYLITMVGNFKGYTFRLPPGAKAPTGRFISIIINAKTWWIMDMGLSRTAPPVSPGSLGHEVMLTWH